MRMWWMMSALVLTAIACSDDDEPADECSGTIPTFSQVTALSAVCTNCHSSTKTGDARNGAPDEDNWDVYATARAEAAEIAEEVEEGAMPPPGSGFTLTAAQKEQLLLWAECGAPQ
jgi:uncharacterized membrane protein